MIRSTSEYYLPIGLREGEGKGGGGELRGHSSFWGARGRMK